MSEEIEDMKDGWLSKKLVVFVVVLAVGVGLAYMERLDWPAVGLLVTLPVAYGVINVRNKETILRYGLQQND